MPAEKRIRLEFSGGYWDGKTLDSQSTDMDEVEWLRTILFLTKNGTKGQAFHGLSPDAARFLASQGWPKPKGGGSTHQYTVTNKIETDTGIFVTLQYSVRPPNK
jgi:hypothetical protein